MPPLPSSSDGLRPFGALRLSQDTLQAVEVIRTHDLAPVRARLVRDASLTPAVVNDAITEYRRYLILARIGPEVGFPDAFPMTSREADAVWHAHLLFTRDYAAFCDRAFDGFLHHDPVSEPRETATPEARDESLAASCRFFHAHWKVFGHEPSCLWHLDWNLAGIRELGSAMTADSPWLGDFTTAFPRFGVALKAFLSDLEGA